MPARAELDAGGASRQARPLSLPTRDDASNVGEELHSHFNYEWDNLFAQPALVIEASIVPFAVQETIPRSSNSRISPSYSSGAIEHKAGYRTETRRWSMPPRAWPAGKWESGWCSEEGRRGARLALAMCEGCIWFSSRALCELFRPGAGRRCGNFFEGGHLARQAPGKAAVRAVRVPGSDPQSARAEGNGALWSPSPKRRRPRRK
jgi:hypothetical protein